MKDLRITNRTVQKLLSIMMPVSYILSGVTGQSSITNIKKNALEKITAFDDWNCFETETTREGMATTWEKHQYLDFPTKILKAINIAFERIINFSLAALLIVPAAVIIIPVYLLYLFSESGRGDFLYRAERLGYKKKLFTMYKIRTMVNNAEKQIGGTWHKHDKTLELWYGSFLRNTKIDELPQLLNILKGDMAFVGPRPVRPADYENLYKKISNCNQRFSVCPGLTGYSQFYTPGSTPRKVRVHIDNYFIRKNKHFGHKILFVARTALQFAMKIGMEIFDSIIGMCRRRYLGKTVMCRRQFPRKMIFHNCIINTGTGLKSIINAKLIDMNSKTLKLSVVDEILINSNEELEIQIDHKVRKKGRIRKHTIKMNGKVCRVSNAATTKTGKNSIMDYLVSYSGKTNLDNYWLEKYLLCNSFC